MEKKREMGLGLDGLIDSMPLVTKELVADGVAGGFAKSAVAPLERIKILFQTRRAEFRSIGLMGSIKKITNTEGFLDSTALHYMTYEEYRRWIILGFPETTRGPVLDLVAGAFAGRTAVVFTYPLDLVRTKLAYQVSSKKVNMKGVLTSDVVYRGIHDCFSKTYKESGLQGLYWGTRCCSFALWDLSVCRFLKFYIYEEMKRHVLGDHRKDITVKLVCGSIAGLLGQTLTYSLDLVRRQMQVRNLSAATISVELKTGTMETLVKIDRDQGWKQLFSGLSINYLKVVPSVAIGFTVYDLVKSYLRVPS